MIRGFKDLLLLRKLMQRRRMDPEQLRQYQSERLRKLVRHAYERVPFYHERFKAAGLHPENVHTIEDLQFLPVTRSDLRNARLDDMLASGTETQNCITIFTTGSSGKPLCVYLSRSEARFRALQQFRALLSIGFQRNDRLVVLGPELPHRTRIHQRLGFYYSENMSSVIPIEKQVDRLKKIKPTIFWVYPNALKVLLHEFGDDLNKMIQPRICIFSSDMCDSLIRDRAFQVFHADSFDFYGSAEIGRIAAECRTHEGFHINEDHLILEITENGVAVVTALHSYTMPFIRYVLGDILSLGEKPCSCGCSFPLIRSIRGRDNDMIRLPDGRILPPHGCDYILRKYPGIEQFRFIQKRIDLLHLQLATTPDFERDAIQKIHPALLDYLGGSMRLEIEQVEFIRESGTKFKAYVDESRLDSLLVTP
jgi:phenylacetate-CoA ligase